MRNSPKTTAIFLFMLSMLLSERARARTVTITITGTVASATDVSGVFGKPGSQLSGRFTLVFTFDDSKVDKQPTRCTGSPPYSPFICSSPISGSGQRSPGTALLQIGDSAPVSFGDSTDQVTSSATRTTWISPISSYRVTLGVGDGSTMIAGYVGSTTPKPAPASVATQQSPPPSAAWDWPIYDTAVTSAPGISFTIDKPGAKAFGTLDANTICIGDSCPILQDPCQGTLPKSNAVPKMIFHGQQNTLLCWAATAQMLMQNIQEGAFYSQCQIASVTLSAAKSAPINCCDSSGNLTCNFSTTAGNALTAFKYRFAQVDALTQEQIKREITCRRPVGVQWQGLTLKWPFFSNHEVIIWGYYTDEDGTLILEIFDPFPYSFQGRKYPGGIFRFVSYDDFAAWFGYSDPLTPNRLIPRQFYYQVKPPL